MITVKVESDSITPDLARLLGVVRVGGELGQVLGRAAANALKKHYRELNGRRANKLGGMRGNFWLRVGQSVNAPVVKGGGVVVPIAHPAIAQKVYGGKIRAKRTKNLAIPIAAKSYGKSPKLFADLVYRKSGRGNGLLGLLGGDGVFEALYVLKPSVVQKPDREALPRDEVVVAAMTRAATNVLG